MKKFLISNDSLASTVITFTHWLANHCPKYDIFDIFCGFSFAAVLVLFALRILAALSAMGIRQHLASYAPILLLKDIIIHYIDL